MRKYQRKHLNYRQKIVVDLIKDKLRNNIPIKSKGALLREAGYSANVADQPDNVFGSDSLAPKVSKLLDKLNNKREIFLEGMTPDKAKKASGLQNAMTVDILTKNIELLSGRATERSEAIKIDDEIFERILERSSDGTERETSRFTIRREK